jgi:AsmA protein
MRKVLAGIGIFIVLVIVGLLIFAATFDVNRYRGRIQSELEQRLGRQVALGDMHLSVFPPRFRVQNPSIGDDPHFSADAPFIKAQELDVSVKLMPLLHKDVQIDSLDLQRPSVNLIKNTAGVWNFSSLGKPAEGTVSPQGPAKNPPTSQTPPPHTPPQPQPNPQPTGKTEQQFSLGELTITDGQISILDQQKGKTPSIYDHIDVSLKNFSPDKPFTVDASVHMAGSGAKEARLQGEGGPIVNEHPEQTPFQGTLRLKDVAIGDVSKFMNSPGLTGTDGVVTGETKINNQAGKLTAQGQTQIQNAKVKGMELGFPVSAQYDLTNDLAADLLTIRNLVLKLGSTPLQMNGTVNSKSATPELDLNVKANNVSIAEAAKLAAAAGIALSQGTTATGNVDANLQVRGSADKPSLNGTINGSNLQLSGKNVAQPIQISSINLNMTPARIQSNPFSMTSGGTTLNTQFTLQNYMSPSPTVDATVRAPNAQLPAVLAMAKAYGVTALDKVNGAGILNLDLRASGPIKSVSTPDIMRALNGTMNLDFNNVKYSGANISRELGSIAGFLNPGAASQSTEGVTNISKMTGNIVVKNGIAQTNNLQAVLDVGKVGAVGTASLVDNTLNLRVTAVLSQGVSQKAGGSSVGGYMQTALANNQGELVIPALVTGTFSNPKFSPDVQQIAQMKLKNFVPNLNNPASLTGALQGLLGGGRNPAQGQNRDQQSQGQQQQPAQQNPVDQLLGLFGKKKAQQPPPK